MPTIQAVFENGVFRPRGPVDLPEQSVVEFEPRVVHPAPDDARLDKIYGILSTSFETGERDIAVRHDEHQP